MEKGIKAQKCSFQKWIRLIKLLICKKVSWKGTFTKPTPKEIFLLLQKRLTIKVCKKYSPKSFLQKLNTKLTNGLKRKWQYITIYQGVYSYIQKNYFFWTWSNFMKPTKRIFSKLCLKLILSKMVLMIQTIINL